MDKNYFKKLRVMDGGMGQELHAKGLISKGTLWSTSAILDEKYHKLIVDTHLAYIESGAEVITTNTFSSRRIRMDQNKVFIAGSIPAQFDTYKKIQEMMKL